MNFFIRFLMSTSYRVPSLDFFSEYKKVNTDFRMESFELENCLECVDGLQDSIP